MKRQSDFLKQNNRGSGIITVLVTVFFITALGAALLFTTYTVYQVKLSERYGKENFYDADTAMSEIRSGVQLAVTEALADAYTDVLMNYNTLVSEYSSSPSGTLDDYMEADFQTKFIASLKGWKSDDTQPLLSSSDGKSYTYDPAVLLSFLSPEDITIADNKATLTDGSTVDLSTSARTVATGTEDAFTLKDITLTYTDARGYRTVISTDITIKAPPFSYTPPAYSVTDVAQYALIAKSALTAGTANLTLSGDAYAGSISVTGSGASLIHEKGNLISAGALSAESSGVFTENAQLWVKDIAVGSSAAVTLRGTAYVADDLVLGGSGASAKIAGKYYGFGTSTTSAGESSSILIDGLGTSLDLSSAQQLMLAGTGFIDATKASGEEKTTYVMGQSVAVKSDQLAYLVPEECLTTGITSNPCLVTETAVGDDALAVIKTKVSALASTKSYYGYVDGVSVAHIPLSDGTSKAAYFFLTFNSQAHANAYFRGYYSAHPDEISSYLKKYLSVYQGSADSNIVLNAGNVYAGTVSDSSAVLSLFSEDAQQNYDTAATMYQTKYRNLCHTLSESRTAAENAPDPYTYIVNTAEVESLTANTEFTDSTNTVAVICRGNYTVGSGTPESVRVVIATGDITVNRAFTGLLIAGGSITMNADVTAGDVSAALNATSANGRTLLSYLNVGSGTGGGAGGTTGESWDPGYLVTYSNWRKS